MPGGAINTNAPSTTPTSNPTSKAPSSGPSSSPISPSAQPSASSASPSAQPSASSASPSAEPSASSASPSAQPSSSSASPSAQPSVNSESPSAQPSVSSASPSAQPSASSASPSAQPSVSSASPSAQPSASSASPSAQPSASSASPSAQPSASSASPSAQPSVSSASPSAQPSVSSKSPSAQPSASSASPSAQPSSSLSYPSSLPFESSFTPTFPSLPSSFSPSYSLTFMPSLSSILSAVPTLLLSNSPSAQPSNMPLLPINSSLGAESSGMNSTMLYGVVAIGVVGVLAVSGLLGRYCYNKSSVQKELSRHDELDSGRAGLTLAITTALANHINLQKSCLGRVSDSIMGMYKKAINQLVNELISVSDQEGFYACNIYAAIPEERQKHFIKLIVATTREVLMPSHRSGFCSFFRSKQNPSIDDLLSNLKKIAVVIISKWQPEAEQFAREDMLKNNEFESSILYDPNAAEVSVASNIPSITATSQYFTSRLDSCYENAEEIELSQINSMVRPSEVVVIDVPDYAQEASISRSVSNSQNGNS